MGLRFSFWILLLIGIILILIVGPRLYKNIYYLDQLKNLDATDISSINYIELPAILESWPSATRLIKINNYRNLKLNDKIKRIYSTRDNRFVADLHFQSPDLDDNAETRSAKLTHLFSRPVDLSDSLILLIGEVEGNVLGDGHLGSRMQIEITDTNGKKMRGPKIPFIFGGNRMYLILRPTITEPIPMGSAQDNFDIQSVAEVSVLFIASINLTSFPAKGKILINNIYVIDDVKNIDYFSKPYIQRIARDNINIGYRIRKLGWDKEYNKFFVGINYPWNNYGWDVGKNPYGEPANSGWSANEEKLRDDLALLKSIQIEPVRIYILFDLRTGLKFTNGRLTGFDDYVRKDIESIFRIAGSVGIKIIPVLFDFGIADGFGLNVGEHPELIFSQEKYNFLVNLMLPLLKDMDRWNKKYGEPVFALELMNEPENMSALIIPGYFESLKVWFQDLTSIIHNETSFKVTLGSSSIVDMQRWWQGLDIDIWQFHFYKYMKYEHEKWPSNLPRSDIPFSGIMFAGEYQPYDITANLNMLRNNGYNGVLLWNLKTDDGFKLKPEQIREVAEWIRKSQPN